MTQDRQSARVPVAHETIPFATLCGPSAQMAWNDGDRRQPVLWNSEAGASGERRRVLCSGLEASGGDADVGRGRLWEMIEQTPNLDWLLLTQAPEHLPGQVPASWMMGFPAHVWMGIPGVTQREVDARVRPLLALPAAVRFLWAEPLGERLDLSPHLPGFDVKKCDCPCHTHPGIQHVKPCCTGGFIRTPRPPLLHWVIAGGDPRPEAPPLNPYWARDLLEQCVAATVKFYFTEWGRFVPSYRFTLQRKVRVAGAKPGEFTDMAWLRDGETERVLGWQAWDEIPTPYAGSRRGAS